MRGSRTSLEKVRAIAHIRANDDNLAIREIARLVNLPETTVGKIIKSNAKFAEYMAKEKKKIDLRNLALMEKEQYLIEQTMDKANYSQLNVGFAIKHDKTFGTGPNTQINVADKQIIITRGNRDLTSTS